ncbi:hypothetical protein [Paraburkholderia bannensis]|uniref:hypothetical protein n=1 Tax=Paraburkholderia bannensis TaxID=765414 RepID=UPI002ABE8778|nr:hypothetical protein [Paraburkholderia bannensis]
MTVHDDVDAMAGIRFDRHGLLLIDVRRRWLAHRRWNAGLPALPALADLCCSLAGAQPGIVAGVHDTV